MSKFYTYLCLSIVALSIGACNKDIEERNDDLPALNPANIDISAADWKPFIATNITDYPLPAPNSTASAAYQDELKRLKQASSNLSGEQKKIIDYWKAGSILRWNEIMRELVAKHNLPPYQNPDNTYPIPNAANPFSYPEFPFSNPPYAARAYAYVSVAQYDALIMAWKFKKQYNIPAPYRNDATVQLSIPASSLPSYPSEDAVIAGASLEMMKLLFPADIDYINKMAQQEKDYRLWSGANVESELTAGDSLGRWVARKIIQRAKTDNMGKSVGDPAMWAKLEADCIAKGATPWISLETPKRPPMLPGFGNVKPLLFDAGNIDALRPPAPPAANSGQMRQELDEILAYVNKPTQETMRVVNFWADGVGTYTPPGHWNAIASEKFVYKQYSEIRWARNLALLNSAMMDAAILCWNTKYYYYNPRPCQLDPKIKTLTGVPNFPAYISGHSTFSGAAAQVLGYLLPENAQEFNWQALEASNSRMYGGIHYRSDCEKGLIAGHTIGDLAIAKARLDVVN